MSYKSAPKILLIYAARRRSISSIIRSTSALGPRRSRSRWILSWRGPNTRTRNTLSRLRRMTWLPRPTTTHRPSEAASRIISAPIFAMASESTIVVSTAVATPSYPPCHSALTRRWNQGSTDSSKRAAVSGSICRRRAISETRVLSTSFQPSRLASISAINPPPLPYSRLMVTTLNMAASLIFRDHGGFDGHPDPQQMFAVLPGIENDLDGNPLHNLDVIPCCIFRRQQAEPFAGGAPDIEHMAFIVAVVRVHVDCGGIARAHVLQFGLLVIRGDIKSFNRHDGHQGLTDSNVLAHLNGLLPNNAVHGRANDGVIQVEFGLIERGLGGFDSRLGGFRFSTAHFHFLRPSMGRAQVSLCLGKLGLRQGNLLFGRRSA